MKTAKFYGGSDDLFECEGALREEIDCYERPGIYRIESLTEGRILVVGIYSPDGAAGGTWCVGIQQVDEEDEIPAWPIRMVPSDVDYSVALEIDLPDDADIRPL